MAAAFAHVAILVALAMSAQGARTPTPVKSLRSSVLIQQPLGGVHGDPDAKKENAANFASEGGPTPMFTEETMPKVSPTVQCVMNLATQYFVLYTALALVRTINTFSPAFRAGSGQGLQSIIEVGCTTVTYAPMLSVLFLGTRFRAIQLAQGETEKYKLPQPWVQQAMFVATWAVLGQVLLVLAAAVAAGGLSVKCDEDGNIDTSEVQSSGMVGTILSVLRYAVMLALYGGTATVCYGVYVMEGPDEIWHGNVPPVAPSLECTMNLTLQFFAVYLAVAVVKTVIEFQGGGGSPAMKKLSALLVLAKYTVNFAPMLCILFVGARMRALQMDPKHGNPQKWAQNCFYLCTYSVLVQTLLVILMPYVMDCDVKKGSSEGDVTFDIQGSAGIAIAVTAVRYVLLFALYGGFTAVIVSVFIIEHPTDVSLTPPISPAMQCVMNLTAQYFFIYLMLFVSITVKQFVLPDNEYLEITIDVFDAARATVMFAPMLSMLFIACRMRALQLTKATDGTIPPSAGPQLWAQEGMFMSTWAVLIQVIMAILVPAVTGGAKPEMDEEGNPKLPEGSSPILGYIFDGIKYLCLILMYGGVVLVMYGIFTMTPETLPPYAPKESLIPGAPIAQPPSPPTPSF